MITRNSKRKRQKPRWRHLTVETCEHRYLLAADLFPRFSDNPTTFNTIGQFAEFGRFELVDISGDTDAVNGSGLVNMNDLNSGVAAYTGNDIVRWISVDSAFFAEDGTNLDNASGHLNALALYGVKFPQWTGTAPAETSLELEQPTPAETLMDSNDDRQLTISSAVTSTNVDTTLPRTVLNNYKLRIGNTLNPGQRLDTLLPPSNSYRLHSITILDLNSVRDSTITSKQDTLARRQLTSDEASNNSPYQYYASSLTTDLGDTTTLSSSDATSDVETIPTIDGTRANIPLSVPRNEQSNPPWVEKLGASTPLHDTVDSMDAHTPIDRFGANANESVHLAQGMVDITHTLAEQGRRELTQSNDRTRIINVTFEPSLALSSSYGVISPSRVQMSRMAVGNSTFVVQPSQFSSAMPLPHASRSRAQAFEFIDNATVQLSSVNLAGVVDADTYQPTTARTRYVPAHVPVPTLPHGFESALPQREFTNAHANDLVNPQLKPTTVAKPHRASTVDIDEREQESPSDRRAATMVFTVFAVQQLWRYDRRKRRAANLNEFVVRGLSNVFTLVELPGEWWSRFTNRWREWKATRRAPPRIFPGANFRGDQQHSAR